MHNERLTRTKNISFEMERYLHRGSLCTCLLVEIMRGGRGKREREGRKREKTPGSDSGGSGSDSHFECQDRQGTDLADRLTNFHTFL